jgi:RES domain
LRTIRRGGPYLRVADPDWEDPLDGRYAAERGGRWNPPESFPVVYLCHSIEVARAIVYRRLARQPYGPEDLRAGAGPVLVRTRVPDDRYLNAITEAGLRDVGLPTTYPRDSRRRIVPHSRCQAIGLQAWEAGLPGIATRSAATAQGEELAYFGRRKLRRGAIRSFERWFWSDSAA